MANRFLNNIRINDSYTLPAADGTQNQVIKTDGAGNLSFTDVVAGEADKALSLTLRVKNTESVALTKGQVVCAAPTATPPSGNVIEVKLADNNGTDSMPAIGILNEGLDAAGGANDEGEAIMFGRISGINTSAFSVGDEVFVSDTAGGLTATKPTGVKYIQKVGVVMRDDASNGTIEIFGAGRTNDVPTPLYIDHANQRVGIGEETPSSDLHINNDSTSPVLRLSYVPVGGYGGGGSIRFQGGAADYVYGDIGWWNGSNKDADITYSAASRAMTFKVNDRSVSTNGYFRFYNDNTEVAEINANGVYGNVFYDQGNTSYYVNPASTGNAFNALGYAHIRGGITTDGNARSYTWRALDNTSSSGTRYQKIARITSSQSSRFVIELAGRSTSYSDPLLPALGYIVGQLNNDNNYDLVFYNHSGEDTVVDEVGQVDVSTTATDIYIKVSSFSEVTAHAHISDGTIAVESTSAGSTEPTNYVAATNIEVWNSRNDGSGSGLDADLLDGQHASAFALSSHNHDDRYYTETESDSRFVNVTGDTMSGALTINTSGRALKITGNGTLDNADASIYLGNAPSSYGFDITYEGTGSGNTNAFVITSTNAGTPKELIRANQDGIVKLVQLGATIGNNIIWHAGNDGSGSGLDADTLDGQHASEFAASSHNHDSDYVELTGDTMSGPLVIDESDTTDKWLFRVDNNGSNFSGFWSSSQDIQLYLRDDAGNVRVQLKPDARSLFYDGLEAANLYDSDNTTYYVNPSSTSTSLNVAGDASVRNVYIGNLSGSISNRVWFNNGGIYQPGLYFDGNNPKFIINSLVTSIFHDTYHPNADTWTTARTITIGNTGKTVDGSADVSWSLSEIGIASTELVKNYQNVNYVASDPTSSGSRTNYGVGVTVYEGYSGGSNRPHTYDATVQFMPTSGQGFELSADWVSTTTTPLKIRSLRDCCQGWSPWVDVAVSGTTSSGTFSTTGDYRAPRFYDSNNTAYYLDPASTSELNVLNLAGDITANGSILGGGNLFLRSYNNDPKGIFFRDGFEYGDTNQYNLSITIYDDGDGAADGMNINAYDGIYFNVQSGTTPNTKFRVLNTEVRAYADLYTSGDLTVSGGDITLGGTGRIQGIDTVSANTDAANKLYVDNHTYSHNHDDRYYTETEADSRFLNVAGDTATGSLRFQNNLNYFGIASTNNEAEIVINTGNAGSPQIGFTEHGDASWAIGIDDGDNSFKIHGAANSTIPTINNLATPIFELTTSGIGYFGTQRIFADNYHPNADTWTASRTITIGNTGKSVNGSANVSWSLAEIGAASSSHTHTWADISGETANSVNSWGGLRHETNDGYIDFGPANSSHAHIYTDRADFYLNKRIQISGGSQLNTSDVRSAIFYDIDNTAYYLNPASTSNLQELEILRNSSNYTVNLTDAHDRAGLMIKSSTNFDSKIAFSSGASSRQYIQALNNAHTTGRDIAINPYGGNVAIGKEAPAEALDVDGSITSNATIWTGYDSGVTNSISCSNWFRSSGSTGWYSASYGGGIHMLDSTWVRVYNNRKFYADNTIESNTGMYAPIFYDRNNTNYRFNGDASKDGVDLTVSGNYAVHVLGTISGGHRKHGNLETPEMQFSVGGGTDLNWKKLIDVVISDASYSGWGAEIEITDFSGNYGNAMYSAGELFKGALSIYHWGGTGNTTETAYANIPYEMRSHVRWYKINETGQNRYQLQVKSPGNYRQLYVKVKPGIGNQVADIISYANDTNGLTSGGTAYSSIQNANFNHEFVGGIWTNDSRSIGWKNGYGSPFLSTYYGSITTSTSVYIGGPTGNGQDLYCDDLRSNKVFDRAATAYYFEGGNTGDSIRVAGDVVAYYSSDKRLKDNIKPIENALDKVNAISGVTFEWNEKSHKTTGRKDVGVVAQEVEEVFPEIVETRTNGFKAVDYQKLTAVLIESVKELTAKVKALESKQCNCK